MAEWSSYRLPRTVVPWYYALTIAPDLASGAFGGDARIRVRVEEPVDEIVLNARDLEIHSAELTADTGQRLAATARFEPDTQRAVVTLATVAAPGPWTLRLSFSGRINDNMAGLYRSRFTADDGTEQVLAVTQLQATDARRVFPCWDEPDFKAVFALTLVIDEGLSAVANSPVERETALGNGKKQVTFGETMKMSTYLVAFAVGPLEFTEATFVDRVPLRVVSVPGKSHLTRYALDVAGAALRFFTDYFGLAYPGDKLDLIAVPDFSFGAMENLGAVTFREKLLLVDPATASQEELERVADVICHELAHMWFGDLVTMSWWNGSWLNEAFATFMQLLAVDAIRPEWERWVNFSIRRAEALEVDGLTSTRAIEFPVERPDQAAEMFDTITYEKGAAVLRMVEQFLGPDTFRLGVRHYLVAHAYANADTSDLWASLEVAAGQPVRALMDSWVFQPGYPLVSATLDPATGELHLAQRRFRYLPEDAADPLWQIPVTVRSGDDGGIDRRRAILAGPSGPLELPGSPAWTVVNDGGWGFYRLRYSPELLERVAGDPLGKLDAIERFQLVSDSWALALAGVESVNQFLRLIGRLTDEVEPTVWGAILRPFGLFRRAMPEADRPALERFLHDLTAPACARLAVPEAEETEKSRALRSRLLNALGTTGGDPTIRAQAAELHAAELRGALAIHPDVFEAVLTVVAWSGGEAEYDQFVRQWRQAPTPQQAERYLYALGRFPQRALADRTLELCLTGEVRPQNVPFLVKELLAGASTGEAAWNWIEANWDELLQRLPANLVGRMLEGIVHLVTPATADRVARFLEAHPVPGAQKRIDQTLEWLAVNVAFRAGAGTGLAGALQAGGGTA